MRYPVSDVTGCTRADFDSDGGFLLSLMMPASWKRVLIIRGTEEPSRTEQDRAGLSTTHRVEITNLNPRSNNRSQILYTPTLVYTLFVEKRAETPEFKIEGIHPSIYMCHSLESNWYVPPWLVDRLVCLGFQSSLHQGVFPRTKCVHHYWRFN